MSRRANVEHTFPPKTDTGAVTVPVWARKIRVERLDDALLVTGERRLYSHALEANLDGEGDLLAAYRKARGFYGTGILPAHTQFANAQEVDDLIPFVQQWGPVWGGIKEKDDNKLSVLQFLEPLQREHRLFSNAARLLSELGKDHPNVRHIVEHISKIAECRKGALKRGDPTLEAYSMLARKRLSEVNLLILRSDEELPPSHPRKRIIYYGHETLCHLLNRFHPVLVPHGGNVFELPQHDPRGVLPALYFMLREDYLHARKLKQCANHRCSKLFVVDGRSRECCTPACSKVVRDHHYYHYGVGRKKRLRRYRVKRQARCAKRPK